MEHWRGISYFPVLLRASAGGWRLGRRALGVKVRAANVDVERVVLVPILAILLALSVLRLLSPVEHANGRLVSVLLAVYQVLLVAFYLLTVVLLLSRSPAKAKSQGLLPRVAAYAGSFAPFLLAFFDPSPAATTMIVIAVLIQAGGLAFTVHALATLSRSFGVVPQVRTLVRTGPFRYIRHPLYVGELVSLAGAVLVGPTWLRWAVFLLTAGLQVVRAGFEERLLAEHLPEYAAYAAGTKRFIPKVY